jgi:hypothetical protein
MQSFVILHASAYSSLYLPPAAALCPIAQELVSSVQFIQAIKVLNMIKIYGKPIRVNKSSQEKRTLDVGANLFIGNLDPDVDEKMLYDTFSAFGVIVTTPKIMRDPDTGVLLNPFCIVLVAPRLDTSLERLSIPYESILIMF